MKSCASKRALALSLLVCICTAAFAQTAPRSPRQLRKALDEVLDQADLRNSIWAVSVFELGTNKTLYERNAEKSLIPASNTKLYTTAAALDLLGPAFRYETRVYTDGEVVDGVLQGNIYVRGSGDPVIGGRFNDGDLTEVFRQWADTLLSQGISQIDGDLIGDDDFFDDQPLGYGWNWDDEPFWYAAEISALSFNDNCIDFRIIGQQPHQPGQITWHPHNTSFIDVQNFSVTLADSLSIQEGYARTRGGNLFRMSSEVPSGRTDFESLSVHNPTQYFVHVLREVFIQKGLVVRGLPRDIDDLPIRPNYHAQPFQEIASHTSPPLHQIVDVINKRSQNLYAEQVLKTIGAALPVMDIESDPGSAAMGIEAAMRTYAQAGVDTSRLQLADGSGLSRSNLVTPNMTRSLLSYMWSHPDTTVRRHFIESLPIGGVDGSLQYRFSDGAAHGNVRAKTGSLGNVSALSGYVTTAKETPLGFVILVNNYTIGTRDIRDIQDKLVELLAQYKR